MTDTLQSHVPDAGWEITGVEDRNDPRMSLIQPLGEVESAPEDPKAIACSALENPDVGVSLAVARDGDQTPYPHRAGHPSQTPTTLLHLHTSLCSWVSLMGPSTSSPCTSQAS